jgi:hypothetical protein
VGEQSQFYVEERALAYAAYYRGHTVAGVNVTTRLGAIVFVHYDYGIFDGGGERGDLIVDGEIAQGFADFVKRGNFFEADGEAFGVAIFYRHAIAMGADAEASFDEASAIPAAEKLLRLFFHFFFFATDERDDIAENVEGSDAGIASAGNGLHGDNKHAVETEGIGKRF